MLKPDAEAQDIISQLGAKAFKAALEADRAGRASSAVVSQYLIAATLFDVLKMFGEDADAFVVDMRKFAKRKGPYIARCLKDGVQPHTGNIDANGNPVATP